MGPRPRYALSRRLRRTLWLMRQIRGFTVQACLGLARPSRQA
jgi:hypothetical protein